MLRALEFSDREHQILCEELKHFYTAVTRARVRVVIYDSDERKRAPMFHFLLSAGLVEAVSLFAAPEGATLLGSTREGVSAEQQAREWQQQGITLRERGLFALAARCFEQSGDAAAGLEAQAREARVLAMRASSEERRRLSLQAAGLFLQSLESLRTRQHAGRDEQVRDGGAGGGGGGGGGGVASDGGAAVRCDAQRFFEGFWNEAGNAEVRRSGTNAVYGETIDVDAISSFGINSEKSNIYSESI